MNSNSHQGCMGYIAFIQVGDHGGCNSGVPNRLFKRHGRWQSETAKDKEYC